MEKFFEYSFSSEMLCIGERVKKGTFKPCITTIPCSTISEALNAHLEREDIFALGFFDDKYLSEIDKRKKRGLMVTAPKDSVLLVSKLPLTTEYLIEAKGKIFIRALNGLKETLKKYPKFQIGALKSKGLGNCQVEFRRVLRDEDLKLTKGRLRTRIYEDKDTLAILGIKEIFKPIYGYLYKKTGPVSGYYQRSLFEGSVLRGPKFILEEVES